MTINIGIVTAEALVLGCDSIASITDHLLDPFRQNVTENGDGSMRVDFDMDDLVPTVTDAWSGVTKMFELSQSPPVAAVTAGLAMLNGLNMSSLASEFAARSCPSSPDTVEQVATSFLHFMRAQYERHYADSPLPEQFRDGPVFLLGGFGATEVFPSLYKVDVQKNSCRLYYGAGICGATWEGQSDAVERMVRGFDSEIRCKVDAIHSGALRLYRAQVAEAVTEAVAAFATQVGEAALGLKIRLPDLPAIATPWGGEDLPIQYATLSLQDAVELAAFLVNAQSARAKFGAGIATVGGRTHIGVVTKRSFKMLDEPQLRHTNTGFTS